MVCLSAAVWAQDLHYSQFYNAPLTINPALTGMFKGDVRFSANFRNQWPRPPVDYTTFTAAADMKFLGTEGNNRNQTGFFAAGLNFNYDQAGYSKLTLVNLSLNASYVKMLNEKFFASVGLQVGASQRNFQLADLIFDNQYDPVIGQTDLGRPTNEDFPNTRNGFLDFSGGINFRYQDYKDCTGVDLKRDRTRVDFGIGIFHLNQPNQAFYEDFDAPLSIRVTPYAIGVIKLNEPLDLIVNAMAQFQDPYQEFVLSAGPRVHLDRTPGSQLALQAMLGLRFNDQESDAWWPRFEVFYRNWRAGVSYDFNISQFNEATDGRGGWEFSVRYIIHKVRYDCGACPLI